VTPQLDPSALVLLGLLAGGVLLLLAAAMLGYLVRLLPISRARRELWARAGPLVAAVVCFAYLLYAVGKVFRPYPAAVPFALVLLLFGFGAAAWFAIKDILAGVTIKAGRICRVGDHVQVGGVAGQVERMGLRVLSIRTTRGDEAIIPYSRIARDSLLRTPVIPGVALHVFRLEVPVEASLQEIKRVAVSSALLSHWSSVVREPELARVDASHCEVTVFALDADHGSEVERQVRQALSEQLSAPEQPGGGCPPAS